MKTAGITRRFPNSGLALEELLIDTKKLTIKKIGKLAQSLNPHSANSLLHSRKSNYQPHGKLAHGVAEGRVFGVPLAKVPCNPSTDLPFIVEKLLEFIEQKGMRLSLLLIS